MEHRIESLGSLTFLGVQEVVRREPDFFQRLWRERFALREGEIKPLSVDGACYGVTYASDDEVFYLAGMAVPAGTPAPEGLTVAVISPGNYVVIECAIPDIGRTYHAIYHELLPSLGMEDDLHGADFERYPRSDGAPEKLEIWVSVRKKS